MNATRWSPVGWLVCCAVAVIVLVGAPMRSDRATLQRHAATAHGGLVSRPVLYAASLEARQREGGKAYAVREQGGAWRADNGAHAFVVDFDGATVRVHRDGAGFALALSGIGRAGQTLAAPAVDAVERGGQQLTYRRGSLTEWYINGPFGLEQGFELVERPSGRGDVELVIDVVGAATPRVAAIDAIVLETDDGARYRYQDLVVYDADGAKLPASMAVVDDRIALRFDDRGARYPIVVDPLVGAEPQAKLTAHVTTANDAFGTAVALSGDLAAIGAPDALPVAAVYVFTRLGTAWTQEANLVAEDGSPDDGFGRAVGADGDTVVVGARGADPAGASSGEAYVFVRSGMEWSQQATLVASDATAFEGFGRSVAISGDTIFVGSNRSVYVFVRAGSIWTEQAKLTASDDTAGHWFGNAVALQGDTALIGTPTVSDGLGSAYIFVRDPSTGTWTEEAKLAPAEYTSGKVGETIALDGDTAVVCTNRRSGAWDAVSGSAYVFVRDPSTGVWTEQTRLRPAVYEKNDYFGQAVALQDDLLVVGASQRNGAVADTGGVFVFERVDDEWYERQILIAPDGVAGALFGVSVALDGATVLVGASADLYRGAAYQFRTVTGASDSDGDGLADEEDNCPLVPNEDQADLDADGVGDPCDPDDDGDGVLDGSDNCRRVGNADQTDTDGDGRGDACDEDADGDGVSNFVDNCPLAANGEQTDVDGDGRGDACDALNGLDLDGDGAPNVDDNCPFLANSDQTDADGDGRGDACDELNGLDVDDDGIANADDNCPFVANGEQTDTDGDGFGDACDEDGSNVPDGGSHGGADMDAHDGGGCAVTGGRSGAGTMWLLVALVWAWRSSTRAKRTAARRIMGMTRRGGLGLALVTIAVLVVAGIEPRVARWAPVPSRPAVDPLAENHPALFAAYQQALQREGGWAYALWSDGQTWLANNEAHSFAIAFDGSGVTVRGEGGRVGLSLATVGRAGARRAVGEVRSISHDGPALTYHRDGVAEWYINGPLGLEQGFTIAEPPVGQGEVELALAINGAATSRIADGGARVILETAGGSRFSYQSLVVYDAAGARLPASMFADGARVAIHFDDRGARYPVVVDPMVVSEGLDLVASDTASGDGLGHVVAVDGDTAVIGTYEGAAYVFVRDGMTWSQQTKLMPDDGAAGSYFGYRVAVDGDTAVVGAPPQAAYVFVRVGETWSQQALLASPVGGGGSFFGIAVDVAGDTVIVGDPEADGVVASAGAVYVFSRTDTAWSDAAMLVASDGTSSHYFGESVALDGDTAVVGASYADESRGAAYVFVRDSGDGGWNEQAKLVASDVASAARFGRSVAVSGDAVVIGAPTYGGAGIDSGAAFVFARTGGEWNEGDKLVAGYAARGNRFGEAVAIAGDVVVVGCAFDATNGPQAGAADLFVRSDSGWGEPTRLFAADGTSHALFGRAVAIDGGTVVVGAPNDSGKGAFHVFLAGNSADGDGIADVLDNCPLVPNESQADADGDGMGDACDDDDDGDGVADGDDNCQLIGNADQLDLDGDGLGDVCDVDVDGDGVDNFDDNCPRDENSAQLDSDADGVGDMCDPVDDGDLDGDGVVNDLDNCPFVANAEQGDRDDDGLGDACDPSPDDPDPSDLDGDGVANLADNCPFVANPSQTDSDQDGFGDACDERNGGEADAGVDGGGNDSSGGGGCSTSGGGDGRGGAVLLIAGFVLCRRRSRSR